MIGTVFRSNRSREAFSSIIKKAERLRIIRWVNITAIGKELKVEVDGTKKEELSRLDGCYVIKTDLGTDKIKNVVDAVNRDDLASTTTLDRYTLDDILDSFIAPNRDPRDELVKPLLKTDVTKLEDLRRAIHRSICSCGTSGEVTRAETQARP